MTITRESVKEEAIQAIHEYFVHGKPMDKPTDGTQEWEFMQEIFDSPADFTGIYENLYERGEDIDFYPITTPEAYDHYTNGVLIIDDNNLVDDIESHFTEWWFAIAAIKVDYAFQNASEIIDEAYLRWEQEKTKRYERITEMLKVWKDEEDKLWKISEDNANKAKYLLLDDLINILEDPRYAEDRLEAYGF